MRHVSKEENNKLIKNSTNDPRFHLPHNIVMKCKLDQILLDDIHIKVSRKCNGKFDFFDNLLANIIYRTNNIVSHTYNFLQLYILHSYDLNLVFPVINKNFIYNIMSIISKKENLQGKPISLENSILLDHLRDFYNNHYKSLIDENNLVSSDKLNYVLDYEQDNIITNIENNIIAHFSDYVKKYVHIKYDIETLLDTVKNNKEEKKKIYFIYDKVTDDLLSLPNTPYTSNEKFHRWIDEVKPHILPRQSYKLNRLYPVKIPIKPIKTNGSKKTNKYVNDMKKYNDNMKKYKNDIKNYSITHPQRFRKIKEAELKLLRSPITKISYAKNKDGTSNVYSDVHHNPFDYLYSMIFINKQIDALNRKIEEDFIKNVNKNKSTFPSIHKLFHVLPLRTSIIPCNITLDTCALIKLFMVDQAYYLENYKKKNLYDEIWRKFFNLDDKIFNRKGYQFNHMIKTNGLSCSIIFVKSENGTPYQKPSFGVKKTIDEETECKYIEEVTKCMHNKTLKLIKKEQKYLLGKNFIYVDPGKKEPINCIGKNCGSENKEDHDKDIEFKYSQKQRNDETKKIRYTKIRSHAKKSTIIKGKTVESHEKELTKLNSKTTDFEQFKTYIKEKTRINSILHDHYSQNMYRQLIWNTYNNTKRSEDVMMNRFEKIYGSPDKCIIILGDYSELQSKKGNEPSITKKLRRIFEKRGYTVYLIDEYNTSKICCHCGKETKNFIQKKEKSLTKKVKKPKNNANVKKLNEATVRKIEKHNELESELKKLKEAQIEVVEDKVDAKKSANESNKKFLVWKLVRCETTGCKTIQNRDSNATKNMRKIVKSLIETGKRPIEYKRKEKSLDQEKIPGKPKDKHMSIKHVIVDIIFSI